VILELATFLPFSRSLSLALDRLIVRLEDLDRYMDGLGATK
jgi:hypothetical protein